VESLWSEMFSWLLGGIGLFFVGVRFISNHLRQLSGPGFRRLVARSVANVTQGSLLGLVAGALTQSSRAVTFILVSMTAAGLISVRQALPVVAWANVGTSALVLVATIDLRAAVLYLLALVGLAFFLGFDQSVRYRHLVGALLGIALLFLSLQFIRTGAAPLATIAGVQEALQSLSATPLLLVGVGALLSAVVQSAASVSVVAVAMTQAGLLAMEQTVLILYGAGVGSSVALYLISATLRGTPRQVALLQVTFNLVAVALLLPLYFIEVAWGVPLVMAAVARLAPEVAMQAALVFLALQLAGAIALTLLRVPLPALMAKRAPVTLEEQLAQPAFLYDQALGDAASAIGLVEREQGRLLAHLEGYLRGVPSPLAGRIAPEALAGADRSVSERIDHFLTDLVDRERDRRTLDALLNLRARQRLLDDLREALLPFDGLLQEARERIGASSRTGLSARLQEAAHFAVTLLHEAAENPTGDGEALASLRALGGDRSATLEGLRRRWLQQVSDGEAKGLEPLFGATTLFERISWLVDRYAQLLAAAPDKVGA